MLYLALRQAEHATGATPEQMKRMMEAVYKEQAKHSKWPKGFF